jgi:hypothetical protein
MIEFYRGVSGFAWRRMASWKTPLAGITLFLLCDFLGSPWALDSQKRAEDTTANIERSSFGQRRTTNYDESRLSGTMKISDGTKCGNATGDF